VVVSLQQKIKNCLRSVRFCWPYAAGPTHPLFFAFWFLAASSWVIWVIWSRFFIASWRRMAAGHLGHLGHVFLGVTLYLGHLGHLFLCDPNDPKVFRIKERGFLILWVIWVIGSSI
jgi:hypothetical protein